MNNFELRVQPGNPSNLQEVYNLIESIQYINTEDELSACRSVQYTCALGPNSRTILFSVFDGMFVSTKREAYVTFQAVNDRPELDLDTTDIRQLVFVEGGAPVPLANPPNSFSVTDDDNAYLQSLTCNLTNPQDAEESLLVTSTPPGLSLSGNGSSVIEFTGNGTTAQYRAALGVISYYSTSTNPTISPDRIVECVVSDGLLVSIPALATIQFQERNNLPRVTLGKVSVEYHEQGPAVLLTDSPSVLDDDDTSLTALSATVTGTMLAGHILSFNSSLLSPGLSTTSTPTSLTVTGTAPIATYMQILGSFEYRNNLSEFSTIAPFQVTFVVTDGNKNTSVPVSVAVMLIPRDDNGPQFIQNTFNFVISESASVGTVVGEMPVTDADEPFSESPLFRFISANPQFGTSDFSIRSKLGSPLVAEVVVNGPLDYDNRETNYTINVLAESGLFNSSAVVVIGILNANDQPPVFVNPPDGFSVFENDTVGAPLVPHQIVANDPDGFPVQYSITTGSQFVSIDNNGLLSLASVVDREGVPGTKFMMTVSVSDGVDMVQMNFTVTVMDINEHPPMFDSGLYLESVTENALPSSTPLLIVQASDRDEEADLLMSSGAMTMVTYSLTFAPFSNYFYISSTSGELIQNTSIDYETTSTPINLTVVANDNSDPPLTSTTLVSITVNNINDERPRFDPPVPETVTITEGVPINLVISATDPDPDDDLRYTLSGSIPSPFMINMITGLVTQNHNPIDVDLPTSVRVFPFTVTVNDTNTDQAYASESSVQANFTIIVEDANDNTPVFVQQLYTMTVSENLNITTPSGFPLITVKATDNDYGNFSNGTSNGNNRITYSLSGAPAGVFAINEDTGLISKLMPLDREAQHVYTFQAVASDNPVSGLPNQAFVTVIINVTDVNDNAPIADPDNYTATVAEDVAVNSTLQTYVAVQWSTFSKYNADIHLVI